MEIEISNIYSLIEAVCFSRLSVLSHKRCYFLHAILCRRSQNTSTVQERRFSKMKFLDFVGMSGR